MTFSNFEFLEVSNGYSLKYISLLTLTVQNALLGLSMRYARTRDGDMFLSSTGNYFHKFHTYYFTTLKWKGHL